MTDTNVAEKEEATTSIAEYRPIETAIARLREKYHATKWVIDGPDAMRSAKEARGEIRKWRLAIEEARKREKASVLERGRVIDGEAKRLTSMILEIEEPCVTAIKEVQDREKAAKEEAERVERERVEKCRAEIDRIRWVPSAYATAEAAELQRIIDNLEGVDLSWTEEFEGIALQTRADSLAKLREMWKAADEREQETARLKAEREELERLRAEQALRDAEEKERQDKADAERRAALAAEEKERRERIEREEAASRARIAEEERVAREAREQAEAEAKAAREERERQEREAREKREAAEREQREREEAEQRERDEKERAERLEAQQRLDGRELLHTFVGQYGDVPEFEHVVFAIGRYFEDHPFGE